MLKAIRLYTLGNVHANQATGSAFTCYHDTNS